MTQSIDFSSADAPVARARPITSLARTEVASAASSATDPTAGFGRVLSELKEAFRRPVPLTGLFDSLLTLGGRQQRAFGFNALSSQEQELYDWLRARPVSPLRKDARAPAAAVIVGVRELGRTFLECASPEAGRIPAEEFGYIELSANGQQILERHAQTFQSFKSDSAKVATHFFATLSTETFREVVVSTRHSLDHIDPVIIYTHDSTFTNFGRFNNLLGRMLEAQAGLLFDDLCAGVSRALSQDEQEFLYCLYVLRLATFRVEEFSGQQLTHQRLTQFLSERLRDFASLCDEEFDGIPRDLITCAATCKRYKERLRTRNFVSRRINGLSFYKNELYTPRDALDLSLSAVPESVRSHIAAHHPVANEHARMDGYFRAAAEDAILRAPARSTLELSPLEELLRVIVEAAISETRSSVGMTRGFRDLGRVQLALEKAEFRAISDYPTQDYYCAVFVAAEARRTIYESPERYKRITTAIATRMTFNGWHYTPGQFADKDSDGFRHYYYPPRMSDRADWSDQHHTGHVQAGVRYSIRSPSSLALAGRKYYGVMDLRLMRGTEPYCDSDVIRAKEYTAYLRAVLQAAADISLDGTVPVVIRAFTKAWYAARGLSDVA